MAGTGAIGRGQESKVRVQESKVRTIRRARVQGKGKSEGQGQDQGKSEGQGHTQG